MSEAGRFVYERLTMFDAEREVTDPVRRGSYEPCCEEHRPGRICVQPRGHTKEAPPPCQTGSDGASRPESGQP